MVTQEIWKPVVGYEDLYEVSNLGNVRSLDRVVEQRNRWGSITNVFKRGVILKPRKERADRYLTVSLWKDGKKSLRYIHRLVAEAFIDNPHGLPEVNHIDENKDNNNVSNLEWCTRAYNATYGNLKDHFKGCKNPSCKLTENDVVTIKSLLRSGVSDKEIADLFNVTPDNIGYIRRGETWGWVS